jgi:N-acetylmuramoyl-L-alanine amidase
MPREHVVEHGECLSSIASRFGVSDWQDIYNASENADFKKKRPDPNVIFPGDKVIIPDFKPASSQNADGGTTVVIKLPERKVQVKLLGAGGKALADVECTLEFGETKLPPAKTDGGGIVKFAIPSDVTTALLRAPGRCWELGLCQLNPMTDVGDDVSGIQARLNNLGFGGGIVSGVLDAPTKAAIRDFERAQGWEPTGKSSDKLTSKLAEIYGC